MITQITAYQTSDGKLFTIHSEAVEHEKSLYPAELRKLVATHFMDCYDDDYNETITQEEILVFLKKYRLTLIEQLTNWSIK